MRGKIAVVTGANAGIGRATAAALADLGAEVVMACRSEARGQAALDALLTVPGRRISLMRLDLADLASVAAFSRAFQARYERLDVLVNNAGMLGRRRALSRDGHEMQFQVNYLGHFLLTMRLLPLLEKAPQGRVVMLSSLAHRWTKLRLEDPGFETGYGRMRAYGHSKLCALLFCRYLARLLSERGSRVTINAAHPGVVASDIVIDRGNDGLRWVARLSRAVLLSPRQGAKTSVFLAADDGLASVSGEYFHRCRIARSSPASQNMEDAARLFAMSRALVADYL
ncbi:MAG: SDR family oxidoreductase [Clostridia bacterium]|nr:SDR family oxidoreductase [Clostridia bacterium]